MNYLAGIVGLLVDQLWDSVSSKTEEYNTGTVCDHGAAIFGLAWNGMESFFRFNTTHLLTGYDSTAMDKFRIVAVNSPLVMDSNLEGLRP